MNILLSTLGVSLLTLSVYSMVNILMNLFLTYGIVMLGIYVCLSLVTVILMVKTFDLFNKDNSLPTNMIFAALCILIGSIGIYLLPFMIMVFVVKWLLDEEKK